MSAESNTNPAAPSVVAKPAPVAQPAGAVSSTAPKIAPASTATPAPAAPTPAPVWPNPLAHLSIPFQGVEYSFRGVHVEATVTPDRVVEAAEQLDREGFSIDTITGVDWMAAGQMEVVYDYFHAEKPIRAVVRTRVPRDNPEVATISKVFPGANWHERETHDFFGIRFAGHPDLSPFLLPEDATYHPLRKDFTTCQ